MKRALYGLLGCLVLSTGVWAARKAFSPYAGDDSIPTEARKLAFSKTVCDTDIDGAWELVSSSLVSSWSAMASDDTLRAVARSSDSAYVALAYVRASDGHVVVDSLNVPPSGVTVAASWPASYYEGGWLRQETSASPVLVWSDDSSPRGAGSLQDTLPPGAIDRPIGHLFSGSDNEMLIQRVLLTPRSNSVVDFEARCYPDAADARDATDVWYRCGAARVDSTGAAVMDVGVRLPGGSLFQLWALGAAANQQACATIVGFRFK